MSRSAHARPARRPLHAWAVLIWKTEDFGSEGDISGPFTWRGAIARANQALKAGHTVRLQRTGIEGGR